mmetsp:Transcript_104376/g.300429  ORF Transcript_104376/g.300429 Transcript_104376/m.300429 type:complete len:224 (+) Transcript_104376:593-1264(+)
MERQRHLQLHRRQRREHFHDGHPAYGLRRQRPRPLGRRHRRALRRGHRRPARRAVGAGEAGGVRGPQHPVLRLGHFLFVVRLVRLQPWKHAGDALGGRREHRRHRRCEHDARALRRRLGRLLLARQGVPAEAFGRRWLLQRHPRRPCLHHRRLRLRKVMGGSDHWVHRRLRVPGRLDALEEVEGGRRRGRLPRPRRLRRLGPSGARVLRQPRRDRGQRRILRR